MKSLLIRSLVIVLVLAGAAVLVAQTAQDNGAYTSNPTPRVPLVTDGNWQDFSFGGVGSMAGPFEFSGAGFLDVADCCLSGDQFEIFDNGVSLGLTSAPTTTGDQIGSDYDTACTDDRWSSASFDLPDGSHAITVVVTASPFGGGGAAMRFPGTGTCGLVGPVPATPPAALAALALLLAVGGYMMLRRSQA